MYKKQQQHSLVFSPTDLMVFMDSPFASWMDRYALESDHCEYAADAEDELAVVIVSKGYAHEKAFLKTLIAEGRQVVTIPGGISTKEIAEATRKAMRDGVDVIYQGYLQKDDFCGFADFLVKKPGASHLGDFHYEVWDTKLSKKSKPYFLIQLCCYAEMLESIQGRHPDNVAVVLGSNEIETFATQNYQYFYRQLKKAFLAFHNNYDSNAMPDPASSNNYGRWSEVAQQLLNARDDLSLVANITRNQIKNLQKAGVNTLTELADSNLQQVKKINDDVFARLKHQALLQKQSKGKEKPIYEIVSRGEGVTHPGLALLPPPSAMDVFFDMEGYPLMDGGLEYLFGNTILEDDKPEFICWWAHDRNEEDEAFAKFIGWVYDRWLADPTMHIYHYGHYEVAAMRRLSSREGNREEKVDNLLRNAVFVDLFSIIRNGVRIGEPRYSIKNVEHIYRGKREAAVADAGTSVAFYEKFMLAREEGNEDVAQDILQKIYDYNKDDCDSTWECVAWLRELQKANNIAWQGEYGEIKEKIESEETTAITTLRDKLLQRPDEDKVAHLLAWLLEWHRREDKPKFWRMFDRAEMSDDELWDDIECLAGLVRTETPPETVKRSLRYEFSFDPNQDTKMHSGSSTIVAHDLRFKFKLDAVDSNNGLAYIKKGKSFEMPSAFNLIPDEVIAAGAIPGAIFDYVENWEAGNTISKAVDDFLIRKRPDIAGNASGPIVKPGEDSLTATVNAVSNLQNSTLCIQGPPGAGKTFVGSKVIYSLMEQGKRVAVMSNSHAAINHMLVAVANLNDEQGANFRIVKVQSKDRAPLANDAVEYIASMGQCDPFPEAYQLMGAVVWGFAHGNAIDQFDYLFIDEAGQVSIANLVAVGRCTKNIVLLGDQMQLGQPVQGSHPGESGKSILDYLMQEHATIPEDLGVFQATTWRMHPEVCRFISNFVYEGRLQPEGHTKNRIIKLPSEGAERVCKAAGLIHIPVEHEGNAQASEEEVEVIQQLVKELIGREYFDERGNSQGDLTLEDILFVAPYNFQVRKLQDALGESAKVGSVDKFQGQEAPVVIISMCASRGDDSPRGLEFILDKNRLNVAISRAQSLAIMVSSTALAHSPVSNLKQMELVNLFCGFVAEAGME